KAPRITALVSPPSPALMSRPPSSIFRRVSCFLAFIRMRESSRSVLNNRARVRRSRLVLLSGFRLKLRGDSRELLRQLLIAYVEVGETCADCELADPFGGLAFETSQIALDAFEFFEFFRPAFGQCLACHARASVNAEALWKRAFRPS